MEEDHTRNLPRGVTLLAALIGILPIGYWVIQSLISEVPRFFDPCLSFWGEQPIQNSARCPTVTSTSAIRLQEITRLIAWQGSGLGAVILGVIGIYRSSRFVSAIGASYLLYEFFVLSMGFAISGLYPLFSGSALLIAMITQKK